MNVERNDVVRVVMRPLSDGLHIVAEGSEFHAACGCVIVFGFRLDNDERTCGYDACDRHAPHQHEFLADFAGPDAPEIDTEVWFGQLLDRYDEADR